MKIQTYTTISPYSGIVIDVTESIDGEDRSTRDHQPKEPLEFHPQYAVPLAEGEPVPY